jgi:3-isopropylmalate dehydrogenase
MVRGPQWFHAQAMSAGVASLGDVDTTLRLAVIPGDGIGAEVVAEGLKVLEAALATDGAKVDATTYDLGAARWHRTGETLPDPVLDELREHDAILLGAVGDPSVPSGVLERGLLLKLRFAFEQAVNLRPVKLYPGVRTPLAGVRAEDVDIVVVREGTEGPYAGVGGALRAGGPHEVAVEESLNTRYGVERVVRDAFRRADARPRRKLTLVHKTNVLTHAGSLWLRTVDAVKSEFPGVDVDYAHVDAACLYFVTQPERFDVVVTDNLFGDIVTDLGAAIAGGIGLAASGNLNVDGTAPSMFEPVHGSAPDIAGTGAADPTATILSVAMLLDHVGRSVAGGRVEAAVAADLAERGSSARRTTEIGDAVAGRLT